MNLRPHLFAAALAATLASCAHAQGLGAQPAPMQAAFDAAAHGTFDLNAATAAQRSDPAWPWLEFAALNQQLDTLPPASAQDFLQRHGSEPVGEFFRDQWLAATAKKQDWTDFLAAWKPRDNVALRCAHAQALQATNDAQWSNEALALWHANAHPLPACEAVFAALDAQGQLTPALRWQRIELAANATDTAVMRSAARGLPADQQAQANAYAAFIDNAGVDALSWDKSERSRAMAVRGLSKLAQKDPDGAEQRLPLLANALQFTDAQQQQVRYAIALWSAANYLPDSAQRFAALPEATFDARLREWQAREALVRSDWPGALAAIEKMSDSQRADSRWQYLQARLLELGGDTQQARALYAQAAQSPTFHGFLAADRLQQPYALCPIDLPNNDAQRAQVRNDAGLARALELWQLQRPGWAMQEWNAALARFDDKQRVYAVEAARDAGWYDRVALALGKNPDENRLYALRFPLEHADAIRRSAQQNGIDPSWVAGEIRAESVFNPQARSAANALGLMQVVPATGAAEAKKLGLPWHGETDLYDADFNIAVGSLYLRELLDKFGAPYAAIAAYNAGPARAANWQAQRPGLDADFWIETVDYKETRDYIARVLAFSVLYDWRMDGSALNLSDRMQGRFNGARKKFVCTAPATPAPKLSQ